jgi:hypothetical protein
MWKSKAAHDQSGQHEQNIYNPNYKSIQHNSPECQIGDELQYRISTTAMGSPRMLQYLVECSSLKIPCRSFTNH